MALSEDGEGLAWEFKSAVKYGRVDIGPAHRRSDELVAFVQTDSISPIVLQTINDRNTPVGTITASHRTHHRDGRNGIRISVEGTILGGAVTLTLFQNKARQYGDPEPYDGQ